MCIVFMIHFISLYGKSLFCLYIVFSAFTFCFITSIVLYSICFMFLTLYQIFVCKFYISSTISPFFFSFVSFTCVLDVHFYPILYRFLIYSVNFLLVHSTFFKSCIHLQGQPNIQATCDEISFILIHSFHVRVAPWWGNKNTQLKLIFNVKSRSYKPLNYKGHCEKSMGFYLKVAVKGYNFSLFPPCVGFPVVGQYKYTTEMEF